MGDNGKNGNGRGQPTKYKEEFAEMARVYAIQCGGSISKLAKLFNVCEATISNWKNEHEDFLEKLCKGQDEFYSKHGEHSLLKLVKGFRYTERTKEARPVFIANKDGKLEQIDTKLALTKTVTKSVAPNVKAVEYALNNRNPKRWRSAKAVEITGKDGGPIQGQITAFPTDRDLTLAEWEEQVKELKKAEKANKDTQEPKFIEPPAIQEADFEEVDPKGGK